MDNSWQQMKCSSSWPSQPSLTPPSLQLPSSSAYRNQMDVNVGHHLHPYIAQRACLSECAIIPEPLVFSTLNLGSYKSDKPEVGNSFLALLSGPSPQLESDFQELLNPKAPVSKLPLHNTNFEVSSNGFGVPGTRISPFPQLLNGESIGSAVEFCPGITSKLLPASSYGGVAILRSNLDSPNLNLHGTGADSAKQVLQRSVHRNDMEMEVSSLRLGRLAGAGFTNGNQHHTMNIQTSQKLPSEVESASLVLPSAFARGKPRVFCLGTSGDLLFSDTGFLGVVCSCHGLPMSVAKFCEHAGSCAINPGDAVRLESGETIAQWCRGCFLKFGMRVPDDVNGWDWPNGIMAPGALVKGKSTTMSNMPKHSDSFGGSINSGQSWNGFLSPNNFYLGQDVPEKSVNKVLCNGQQSNSMEQHKVVHNGQQRNSMERHKVVHNGQQSNYMERHIVQKSFAGTSQNIFPSLTGNQMLQAARESSSSMSKTALDKGRKSNWYPSIDIVGKCGSPIIADPSFRFSKYFGTATNVSSCNNLREAFVMDVDGAVPSNIELRLGQPSQQSNTLGDSTLPPVRPLSFESPFDIPKSRFCEPLVHNALNPRVTDELRQNLVCAPSDISNSNGREENSELDLVRHALRSLNAMDPAKLEQLKGDVTKSSQISMFLSHFINPTERDMQSHVPKCTDNTVSNGEHCMPKVLGGDSQIAKFDPADFPRNMADGLNGKLNTNELVHSNFMDKGKWSRTLSDNCHVVAKSDTLFHNKQMADSDPFVKDVNEHYLQSSSAVHDKISSTNLHQLAVTLADASDARNSSHQFWKTPCLEGAEHLDQVFKSVRSGTASGIAVSGLSTSAVPFGSFSSPNILNLSKKKSSDVNQHMLDENQSLLALKHLVELSEQKNSTASLEINAEQGRAYCTSDTEMRRKNLKEDLITSLELRDGSSFTNRQDAAVDAARSLQSFCNHYSNDGHEKSGMAGKRNCVNFSNLKQKIALCSNELGALVLPFHAHGASDQPSLRLGRTGNEDTTDSRERERCRQKDLNSYLPGNCGCAVHSTCLTRSCICIGTTSINASKHTECIGVKAPALFGKDNRILKDQRVLLSWGDGFKGHSSQWRDVPSKVTGNCISTLIERPAEELDGKEAFEDQLADTAAKGFGRMSDGSESLKEQQMSNVCSRLSPAVTEVSVGVNNADSCTMDDGDGRYARDLVIDEGSGIEKCSSSDDALESERWAETLTVLGKTASITEWCSSKLPRKLSRDLVDEFQLKESRNLIQTGCTVQEHTNCTCQLEHGPKAEKGRRKTKWKSLDAAFPASCISPGHDDPSDCTQHSELHIHLSKEMENSLCDDHAAKKRCCIYTCGSSSLKRKRSALSCTKFLPRKRNLHGSEDHHKEWEDDYQTQLSSDNYFNRIPKPKIAAEKKVKRDWTADLKRQVSGKDGNHVDAGKFPKYKSLGCEKNLSCHVDTHKKARPVVCGNLGIISNGKLAHGIKKPAKIISLRSILKVAKRCTVTENDVELTNACLGGNNEGCHDEVSLLKKESDNGTHKTIEENKAKPRLSSMLETMKKSFSQSEGYDELSILKKDRGAGGQKSAKLGSILHCSSIQMRQRYKETRMRSLYELTEKGKSGEKPGLSDLVGNDHSQIVKAGLRLKAFSRSALVNALRVKHHSSTKFCSRRNSKRSVQTYFLKEKSRLQIAGDNQDHPVDLSLPNAKRSSIKESRSNVFVKDFDIFCCVCGSSNNDEFNRLLECSCCLIRVHQACYGVSKAPKGCWCCRPCRTNSKNIACVLCGYEGGAMTRALKSQNIVKGLLDAWKGGVEEAAYGNSVALSDAAQDHLGSLDPIIKGGASRPEELESVSLTKPMIKPLSSDVLDANSESVIVMNTYRFLHNIQVQNTITAGVLDPTITQWVHVVCGLWTPGTRCPNVNTMSTFDVSGASRPKKNMVCSICSRPGGSCIRCRLPNCSVHFHPWCGHQKGLLQSEIEGVDNDKVGFYGRCLLHATNIGCHTSDHPVDQKEEAPKEKDFTCARTEEQINAWLHINGQKCIRGHVQPQASEIEHDCRKEYTRYKQSQGWRHLVVYKSGIHALGLYTSQFISRGAMVVEYVGEIVGLRVADKREVEYQSGRKVQYKSACYFFRIDKEHIIDATRKGGIARFVNHSCLPNCVAKVISVRNEKKVVFFAERDINPGEEITYDYHFNNEDEGKKIPCFCNSKNCRRYLN